jgi:Domain of unknown function (DUF4340)
MGRGGKMQLRKTMLALVVLAIIGGFALYVGRHPQAPKFYKLFSLAPADIAKIELHGPARDLVIERGALGLWRIVKPVAATGDPAAVDALADAIANLQVVDTVDQNAGDRLANFGLQNPSVTVTVTTKDQRVLPGIMVGSDSPLGGGTYVKTTDKPAVLLIGAGFTAESSKTLNDLRSRVLVNLTADQMTRVAVTHADGSAIEIVRHGDDWKMTKPRAYPTDKAAVQQMLDIIAGAQVADFVEDNPADLEKFGLAKPALEFEVNGGKDNAKHSISIGFKQPEASKNAVYARAGAGNQPVVTIAGYVVNGVDKSFDDLRDKTVLLFDEAKVARITLIGGPVSIVVERAPGDHWSVIARGRTAPAQQEVAASLLDQIHGLKGSKIVEDPMTNPQRFGMVRPNLSAVLYDQSGKEIGGINVAEIEATLPPGVTVKAPPQTFGYATSSADQAVYQILADQVVDLENTASTLQGAAEPKPATPSNPSPSTTGTALPAGPASAAPSATIPATP